MSKYIVIPKIQINNANAQPVWWIVSSPAVTAYVGFAQALALYLGEKTHEGIAIVHHDIQFLGEQLPGQYNFLPHQFRASVLIDDKDYAKQSHSLSAQPTARCHLNVSIVIAMPDEFNISEVKITKFLRGARLAGGNVIQHGKVQCNATTQKAAIEVIGRSGHSIIERQDLMEIQAGDRDYLDVLLRQTRRYKNSKTEQEKTDAEKSAENEITQDSDTVSDGWIVPTCLGYVGISSLQQRTKSRQDLPHMYVEPLVGLVQYQSLRTAGLHFWRYTHPQSDVFITTTQ